MNIIVLMDYFEPLQNLHNYFECLLQRKCFGL
jgi:hypothetical protein